MSDTVTVSITTTLAHLDAACRDAISSAKLIADSQSVVLLIGRTTNDHTRVTAFGRRP